MNFRQLWKKPWIYLGMVAVVALVLGLTLGLLLPKKPIKPIKPSNQLTPEQIKFFDDLRVEDSSAGTLLDNFKAPELQQGETIESFLYVSSDYILAKVLHEESGYSTTSIELYKRNGNDLTRVLDGVTLDGDAYDFVARVGNAAVIKRTMQMDGGSTTEAYGLLNLEDKTLEVECRYGGIVVGQNVVVFSNEEDSYVVNPYDIVVYTGNTKLSEQQNVVLHMLIDDILVVYTQDECKLYNIQNNKQILIRSETLIKKETNQDDAIFQLDGKYYVFEISIYFSKLGDDKILIQYCQGSSNTNFSNEVVVWDIGTEKKVKGQKTNKFLEVNKVGDGYFAITILDFSGDTKFIYIDENFNVIWESGEDLGELSFSTKNFLVFNNYDKTVITDKSLNILGSCQYNAFVTDDIFVLKHTEQSYKAYDKNGKEISGQRFDFVSGFYGNKALARTTEYTETENIKTWYILNSDGTLEEIKGASLEHENVMLSSSGLYVKKQGGKYTICNLEKETTVECDEIKISFLDEKLVIFTKCSGDNAVMMYDAQNIVISGGSVNILESTTENNDNISLMGWGAGQGRKVINLSGSWKGDVENRWADDYVDNKAGDFSFSGKINFKVDANGEDLIYEVTEIEIKGYRVTALYWKHQCWNGVWVGGFYGDRHTGKNENLQTHDYWSLDNQHVYRSSFAKYVKEDLVGRSKSRANPAVKDVWLDIYLEPITYSLKYHKNDGSGTTYTESKKYGEECKLNSAMAALWQLAKPGYDFNGWKLVEGESNLIFPADWKLITTPTTHGEVREIYADWTPKEYDVIFKDDGGSVLQTIKYAYNTEYGTLPEPTRVGYTFEGWWTTANYAAGTKVEVSTKMDRLNGLTLYAKWRENVYTINFYENENVLVDPMCDVRYSEEITMPRVSRTNYTLIGWATSPNGSVAYTLDKEYSKLAGASKDKASIDLYAVFVGNIDFYKNGDKKWTYKPQVTGDCTISGDDYLITWCKNLADNWSKYLSVTIGDNIDDIYNDFALFRPNTESESAGITVEIDGVKLNITLPRKNKEAKATLEISSVSQYVRIDLDWATINYNTNGGEITDDNNKPIKNEKVPIKKEWTLKTPVRDGYTFSGWEMTNDANVVWGEESKITPKEIGDIKLSAKWTVNQYNVTFDAKGGSVSEQNRQVTFDAVYGELPVPTRTGYTFSGWYLDETRVTSSTTVKTAGDHTLYAKWTANSYVVSFNANGGSAQEKITVTYDAVYGELPVPTRTGYTFSGWYLNSAYTTSVTDSTTVKTAGDHTLYAKWTAHKYKVVFISDGGSEVESITLDYDQVYTLPVPTKEGYTFSGWKYKDTTYTDTISNLTDEDDSEVTLIAQWANKPVQVTFDFLYDGKTETRSPDFDTNYLLPDTTRTGYTFSGWYTKNGTSDNDWGTQITAQTIVKDENAHTLYAKWTANEYTVSFNLHALELSTISEKTVTYESTYGTLPVPVRTGYTFGGWWTENGNRDGQWGEQITAQSTVTKAYPHTLHAKWIAHSYTIIFEPGEGSGTMNNQALSYSYDIVLTPLDLNQFTAPAGKKFAYWQDETGKQYTDGAFVANLSSEENAEVTLVAIWVESNYTITFDPNGGNGLDFSSKQIQFASNYGTLPTPTKLGATFDGWWTTPNFIEGSQVFENSSMQIPRDHTLYAKWKNKKTTITFDPGEGTCSEDSRQVEFGSAIGELPTPTYTGRKFMGWYLNDTKITNDWEVNSEQVTLIARYEQIEYTVNIYNSTNLVETHTLKYLQVLDLSSVEMPTSGLYRLLGYATQFDGDETFGANETIYSLATQDGADVDLYAVWGYTITFMPNGASGQPVTQTIRINQNNLLKANNFERKYCTFIGWATSKDGDVAYLDNASASAIVPADGDITLYAVWEVASYTITYEIVGTAGETLENPNPSTFLATDETITLKQLSLAGYEFLGFYTAREGGDPVRQILTGENSRNHTIFARFSALHSAYVTFIDQNGVTTTKYIDAKGNLTDNELFIFNQNHTIKFDLNKVLKTIEGADGYKYFGVRMSNKNWHFTKVEKTSSSGTIQMVYKELLPKITIDGSTEIVLYYTERTLVTFDLGGKGTLDFGADSGDSTGNRIYEVDLDGTIADEIKLREGKTVETLKPVGKQHTFGYWKLEDNSSVNFTYPISGKTDFIAHWLVTITYKVVVDYENNKYNTLIEADGSEKTEIGTNIADLKVWSKWALTGAVENNDYYIRTSEVGNIYRINGKIYRMLGIEPNGATFDKNETILIKLVERVTATFNINLDKSIDQTSFELYLAQQKTELLKLGFEVSSLATTDLDAKFTIIGDKNSELPFIAAANKKDLTFAGWAYGNDIWENGKLFTLQENTTFNAVYITGEYKIRLYLYDDQNNAYVSPIPEIELLFGSKTFDLDEVRKYLGELPDITIEGVTMRAAAIYVAKGNSVDKLIHGLTTEGVEEEVTISIADLANGHVNIYVVYEIKNS